MLRSILWISLLLLITLVGCESVEGEIAPVSGRITLDGMPLVNAAITFQPVAEGNSPPARIGSYGRTNAQGEFELRLVDNDQLGASVGKHRVTISVAQPGQGDEAILTADERLPRKFRDGTETFRVPTAGTTQANFSLQGVVEGE